MIVQPYPFTIEDDPADAHFKDCWYASSQLFFTCYLCPTGGRSPTNTSYRIGPDDLLFHLVFFSTFEELNLPIHGPMEDAGVVKLYDPSPIPCLYVAPVANVLGRVPLIPLFLAGNSTPTIPHKFSKHMGSGCSCCRRCLRPLSPFSWLMAVLAWFWCFASGPPTSYSDSAR